uniref:Uncharacterized protein n=1 Tax=Sphaerodactylus townsendi TaxID=933632 RepID=A0ACB8EMC7_9SAUR
MICECSCYTAAPTSWTKEQELNPDVILRTLTVTFQKEERTISHFQYVAWPDRGIPDTYGYFLNMIEQVRCKQGEDSTPISVHCSAGCGRTGVICTLDYIRQLLLKQRIPPHFSIFDVVLEMRKQRPAAVQTQEQYGFVYHAVIEMFRAALGVFVPNYENLKELWKAGLYFILCWPLCSGFSLLLFLADFEISL